MTVGLIGGVLLVDAQRLPGLRTTSAQCGYYSFSHDDSAIPVGFKDEGPGQLGPPPAWGFRAWRTFGTAGPPRM
eukprot:6310617-Pyramimonas_sp.AAC.1